MKKKPFKGWKHFLKNNCKCVGLGNNMVIVTGKSVFGGIKIGKLAFLKKGKQRVERRHVMDTEAEITRFENAKLEAIKQLQDLYQKALKDVGEENASLFEIHEIMLEDLDYNESILHIIRGQEVNAEYAVSTTADNFARMFSTMDDAYMRGRAADIVDISERLVNILSGVKQAGVITDEPVIVAADDLVPSETVQLDKKKVLGFATMYGSVNSHTAILARTMNIPAIIGLGENLKGEYDGAPAIIDGFEGKLYINPDKRTLEIMKQKQAEEQEKRRLLQELRGKETITLRGQMVKLYANIGNSGDVGAVLQNDAEGIGLFRSEFLYLENDNFPTEEQQFAVYKLVAETMAGKKVIIRTLDIGADKQADYFQLEKEENPALGYRAIRICLTQPEIFKTQLRAILRASAFGQIAVMFPMIISVSEVKRIKEILEEVKTELREAGVRFQEDLEIGIMIETPAAIMESRKLAKEVDFFSIGTNDLIQYTLAIDRQNPKLDEFYDAHHPAVLAMIRMATENAHAEGKWIGICGELGADLELTETFLEMGIDELSVSPSMILPLRKKIRESY